MEIARMRVEDLTLPRMDLRTFTDEGYLQELNRQFLHPLGLAMAFARDLDSGEVVFYGILDAREDPAGVIYAPDVATPEKARWVAAQQVFSLSVRQAVLGYGVQPLEVL